MRAKLSIITTSAALMCFPIGGETAERRREETGRSGAGGLRTERAELEARERPRAVQRKGKGP